MWYIRLNQHITDLITKFFFRNSHSFHILTYYDEKHRKLPG